MRLRATWSPRSPRRPWRWLILRAGLGLPRDVPAGVVLLRPLPGAPAVTGLRMAATRSPSTARR